MNRDRFDDLVVRFSQRRLGRRELLRRAAAGGLCAAAAGATVSARPARARQGGVAAAPTPTPTPGPVAPGADQVAIGTADPHPYDHDPPKPDGWPVWAPWPLPATSGPVVPLPAPAQTRAETDIRAYEVRLYPEAASGWVVGLDGAGQSASHLYVQFGDVKGDSARASAEGVELRWAIADPRARAGGTLRLAPDGADGVRLEGNLNGKRFAATAARDGTIRIKGKSIALDAEATALLAEWGRLDDALFEVGRDLGLTADGTSAQAGCGACLGVGIGLSVTAPACIVLFGCGGAWVGAATSFVLTCGGACS